MDDVVPGMRALSAEGVDVGAVGVEVVVGGQPYLTVWPSAGAPRPVLVPRDAVVDVAGGTVRLAWPAARIFESPGASELPGILQDGAPRAPDADRRAGPVGRLP